MSKKRIRLLCAVALGIDYVVKPFGIAELLVRSEALLRRQMRSADSESRW